jgi:hypothetical protein
MATFGPPPTVARADLFPRSADQRQLLRETREGSLWTDPDFLPTDASLYGRGKARPASMPAVHAWLRPSEFAPLAPGESHALVFEQAAAGDVVQGALGDCYLLGALSAVAASQYQGRSRLLQLILPSDGSSHENPPEGSSRGLFTFRLYVYGEWVQVSVDTLVPCGADRRPLFARCREPRELWAIYLEKAYAKLHRSYAAIEGGSLTTALVDLTGGFAERIELDSPAVRAELATGALWRRLMRYQRLGYLMGCAVAVAGGETEERTAYNLMQNHAYGVLLHYEQALGDGEGAAAACCCLLPAVAWCYSTTNRRWEMVRGPCVCGGGAVCGGDAACCLLLLLVLLVLLPALLLLPPNRAHPTHPPLPPNPPPHPPPLPTPPIACRCCHWVFDVQLRTKIHRDLGQL